MTRRLKVLAAMTVLLASIVSLSACTKDEPEVTEEPEEIVENQQEEVVEEEKKNSWLISKFSDGSDKSNGVGFISLKEDVVGVYNDAEVSEGELKADIVVGEKDVCVVMWDNKGSKIENPVGDTYDKDGKTEGPIEYKATFTSGATKCELTGVMYPGGDRIHFGASTEGGYADRTHSEELLKLLKSEEAFNVYIESAEDPKVNYKFDVEAKGFKDEYKNLF